MTRRFILRVGALLVVFGVVVALLVVRFIILRPVPPPPGVTVENYKRIQIGMPGKEVVQLLGGSGHIDWRSPGYYIWTGSNFELRLRFGRTGSFARVGAWVKDDGYYVLFGELVTNDGEVILVPGSPEPLPSFDRKQLSGQ
jgi:hypothetical protein